MNTNSDKPSFDPAERRPAVLRTAAIVGAIAVVVYLVFILSGVVGR